MAKERTPLEELELKHSKESAERRAALEAAMKDVRDAEAMLREAREKAQRLQAAHLNASFAYDAERTRLGAELKARPAA